MKMILPTIRNTRCGFTLVELVIVLMIISVITMVVVPYATNSGKDLNAQQFCLNIIQMIRYAISKAELDNVSIRIVFDVKNKTFYLEEKNNHEDGYESVEGQPGKVMQFGKDIVNVEFENFESESNLRTLVFDPAAGWPIGRIDVIGTGFYKVIEIDGMEIKAFDKAN